MIYARIYIYLGTNPGDPAGSVTEVRVDISTKKNICIALRIFDNEDIIEN